MSRTLAVAALATFSVFAGGLLLRPATVEASTGAQDRGPPRDPPRVREPLPVKTAAAPLVYGNDGTAAAGTNGILAVTGSYGVGTSVLYLIDTVSRQLAVYEARGGSQGSRRVYLVGARKIDLDLQLQGYNDESEWPYEELLRKFEGRGPTRDKDAGTGITKPPAAPDAPARAAAGAPAGTSLPEKR
jgi:hypothetical protein